MSQLGPDDMFLQSTKKEKVDSCEKSIEVLKKSLEKEEYSVKTYITQMAFYGSKLQEHLNNVTSLKESVENLKDIIKALEG